MASRFPISVAIVAKNEADRLGRCLESVGFVDDIVVVVDESSTDETAQIAGKAGCNVLIMRWQGFAAQKQTAVDRTKHDWVLILDADELVPQEIGPALFQCLAQPDPGVSAYSLYRRNFFHGRWIRRCGWWPDRIVRLVNKKKGCFSDDLVHEHWVVNDGAISQLDAYINHYSFRNYGELINKLQRYSSLSSRQLFLEKKTAMWWEPAGHGLWTFVQNYLFRLGFTEGLDGLVISLLNAGGSFFKYAKLRELCQYGDK